MHGWAWLMGFVAVYDAWAGLSGHKTLSSEFRDTSRSHPVAVSLGTAYLLAHLAGLIPRQIDPLSRYTAVFARARSIS